MRALRIGVLTPLLLLCGWLSDPTHVLTAALQLPSLSSSSLEFLAMFFFVEIEDPGDCVDMLFNPLCVFFNPFAESVAAT
jgi:hypothetical protein